MPRNVLVATFSDADRLVRAAYALRQERFRIYDAHTPYPVHDLDKAMGVRRTRLPWVTLALSASAFFLTLLMQFCLAVFDWPLNVGGKPDNSTLAFIPISFELTVLAGAIGTVLALFVRARLYPGKRRSTIAASATNDAFALVLRMRDASFDVLKARLVLERQGANLIEEWAAEL